MQVWRTAAYLRLSREDGDKAESDSITNQRTMLKQYIQQHPDLELVDFYQDDGYTGTNFDRPAFRRMEEHIRQGHVNCVLVKDLSRFGRNYIEMGRYLEQIFPALGVRFIAINDHVDSQQGKYDMILPIKNLFNTQYARDISEKVRSSIQTKQKRGDFVGAFASYGYRKDPQNHNRLLIDSPAAQVVQRIFQLFEQGAGKISIAKQLNQEGIPSPSTYKKMLGERYHNGRRINQTTYWTYATIHRILQNQMYVGNMEQGRTFRATMHGKARQQNKEQWVVVTGTHEAIISPEQWNRVQQLLHKRTRKLDFSQNQSPFAGFLRCGDCGRAMVKTNAGGGRIYYSCGSYKRYGPQVCTKHSISHAVLEEIVCKDLNQIIAAVHDLKVLEEQTRETAKPVSSGHKEKLTIALERLKRLKKEAYEDYKDGLLEREEYRSYQHDYQQQIQGLERQLSQLEQEQPVEQPWIEQLLRYQSITHLDRVTVAETIREILVYEDGHIHITYTFSNMLGILPAPSETPPAPV